MLKQCYVFCKAIGKSDNLATLFETTFSEKCDICKVCGICQSYEKKQ